MKHNSEVEDPEGKIPYRGETNQFYNDVSVIKATFYEVEREFKKDNAAVEVSAESISEAKEDTNYKLPRMKLKIFDWDVNNWQYFIGLFNSNVHNNVKLSDCEKEVALKG